MGGKKKIKKETERGMAGGREREVVVKDGRRRNLGKRVKQR